MSFVTRHIERRFEPRPASALAARRFVGDAVRGTTIDCGAAMLLTGELVNNAILHARGDFEVRVGVGEDDDVRVEVINHAPEMLLVAREGSSDGGRGLAIIRGMADAWGFESRTDSKSVRGSS